MDLIKILKQFKNIEADKGFAERSRSLILGREVGYNTGFFRFFLKNIESGAALAMAGLLVFVILGGLSAWNATFSPAPFEALNPTSLRVEAQAVDIQIELANLSYNAAPAKSGGESTAPSSLFGLMKPQPKTEAEQPQNNALSIDEALKFLSE